MYQRTSVPSLHNDIDCISSCDCRQSFHKMFSKEIKNGIKEAHGMKAKVFSISAKTRTPGDVHGDGANSQLAPWSKLGANAPTWERLPWDANDAGARFCWFPTLVPVCTFGRKYTHSRGEAKIPCLYLVQKDFSKKTQLTEVTMTLRMRCPFMLHFRSLTPLNLFTKRSRENIV